MELFKAIGRDGDIEPVTQRKRRHGEDEVLPQIGPTSVNPASSSSSVTQHTPLELDLNAPSIFTSDFPNDVLENANNVPDAQMSQDVGAVLGNINFGALFGFGNTNMDIPTGLPPGYEDISIPGTEDWMGMSFDLG